MRRTLDVQLGLVGSRASSVGSLDSIGSMGLGMGSGIGSSRSGR